jgi:transposase
LHYFCVYLPHADGCFVKAYPAGPAETFSDGHVAALDFSGDNSRAGWMWLC